MGRSTFALQGQTFTLVTDGQARKVTDRNGVEWTTDDLIELAGAVEATTALAWAIRAAENDTVILDPR